MKKLIFNLPLYKTFVIIICYTIVEDKRLKGGIENG